MPSPEPGICHLVSVSTCSAKSCAEQMSAIPLSLRDNCKVDITMPFHECPPICTFRTALSPCNKKQWMNE